MIIISYWIHGLVHLPAWMVHLPLIEAKPKHLVLDIPGEVWVRAAPPPPPPPREKSMTGCLGEMSYCFLLIHMNAIKYHPYLQVRVSTWFISLYYIIFLSLISCFCKIKRNNNKQHKKHPMRSGKSGWLLLETSNLDPNFVAFPTAVSWPKSRQGGRW